MIKKGDCIIFTKEDERFGLILHHSYSEDEKIYHGFILLGDLFKETPTKEEIKSSGILGYKMQGDTTDLVNSLKKLEQKHDDSIFYTGVKYDVIRIPNDLIFKEESRIEKVANLQLHEEFYPLPESYSRQNDYDEICDLIKKEILKRDPNTIIWNRIYDSHPLKEILKK